MQENYLKEIKDILLSDLSVIEKKKRLEDYHKSDIADVLETLTREERFKVYSFYSLDELADIFPYYDDVEEFVEELNPEFSADILEKMDSDEAIDILDELDEKDKLEIIELLEKNVQAKIKKLAEYEDNQLGSYMSDNFIVIHNSLTIKEAMSILVKDAGLHDNINTIFVIDENNEFFGVINLKDLIIARSDDKLLDICRVSYPFFYDNDIVSDCINKLKDYGIFLFLFFLIITFY